MSEQVKTADKWAVLALQPIVSVVIQLIFRPGQDNFAFKLFFVVSMVICLIALVVLWYKMFVVWRDQKPSSRVVLAFLLFTGPFGALVYYGTVRFFGRRAKSGLG